jgi:hypothetical protein
MTPEQILKIAPKVLTQAQREFYFSEGYLYLERAIGDEWIAKLRAATDEMVAAQPRGDPFGPDIRSRADASPDAPRLRRVSNPVEQHPVFWQYCLDSVMPDIVADLVGPDVKFHHSKLNFKWPTVARK